ncbi:odorant receptor 9a-like [Leptopilina heterotoma]|uniref:odorant receptor 9a-like n=1 Tax=Leptopilina heterotoma TaxID=63436 RepID=UPI001CA95D79|nr:odorant receptor 9a-like [Leptopilina heterotoma]
MSIIAKRETIMEAKRKLLANICKPRDFYEQDVLEKCSQDCRWKVLMFLLLANVTGATILMSPLIKQNKTILPLRGWYPYSLDTKVMFCITYIYQIVAVLMSVCITASVEGLALTLMLQISAQLELCVHRIQFLPKICKKFNSELYIRQGESKLIKDCVKHHKHIYLMGKNLNNLFSGVIFVHFFASVASLCVIIYQLSRLGTKDPTYWIMISSVGTILTQTFLYCYYGEKIIEKSMEVADSIYEINWINLKNTTKRDLIVMMLKAAKPIQLAGASIMVMSIKTFIKILRSAYSAYNLLANI